MNYTNLAKTLIVLMGFSSVTFASTVNIAPIMMFLLSDTEEISTEDNITQESNGTIALVNISTEEAGDNCSNGGSRIDVGIDLNASGILDEDEITSTSYVCTGTSGSDGEDGLVTLFTLSVEEAGDNCSDGGMRIDSGVDSNTSGVLDDEEITSTSYLCNGTDGNNGNAVPVADAGEDQTLYISTLVTLDGSESRDGDLDAITYVWTISSQPSESNISLLDSNSSTPSFTPTVDGDYVFKLIVNDGTLDSISDSVTIRFSKFNFSFSTTSHSQHIGQYTSSDDGLFFHTTLSSDEKTAYISSYDEGFLVLDISDITNPTLLDSYENTKARQSVLSADGDSLYLSSYTNGLQVFDVSNSSNITLTNTYSEENAFYNMALSSDEEYLYLTDRYEGLIVLDLSDLTTTHKLETNGTAYDVVLSSDNNTSFIADGEDGLFIADVSDPTNPTYLGGYETSAYSLVLSSDNNTCFIAGTSSLTILDVSTPSNPTLLSELNITGIQYR